MVEYILVVTVSVIIILGLAQRLYKPLGDFVEGFMGTYVACLLETGELPVLGANASGSGECKVPIMGAGEEFGGEAPPPGSQSKSGSQQPDDSDKVTSNRGNDGSGSAASGAGGGRGLGSGRRFTVGSGTASGDGGGGAGGRRIVIALEGGGSGSFFGNRFGGGSGSIYRRESRYVAVTGAMAQEAERRQEREASRSITQKVEGESGGGSQRKKTLVTPPAPSGAKMLDDEIKGFDYSQIVKYILIAGIIIILLVLIGGQALQLSKSWEKGE